MVQRQTECDPTKHSTKGSNSTRLYLARYRSEDSSARWTIWAGSFETQRRREFWDGWICVRKMKNLLCVSGLGELAAAAAAEIEKSIKHGWEAITRIYTPVKAVLNMDAGHGIIRIYTPDKVVLNIYAGQGNIGIHTPEKAVLNMYARQGIIWIHTPVTAILDTYAVQGISLLNLYWIYMLGKALWDMYTWPCSTVQVFHTRQYWICMLDKALLEYVHLTKQYWTCILHEAF